MFLKLQKNHSSIFSRWVTQWYVDEDLKLITFLQNDRIDFVIKMIIDLLSKLLYRFCHRNDGIDFFRASERLRCICLHSSLEFLMIHCSIYSNIFLVAL